MATPKRSSHGCCRPRPGGRVPGARRRLRPLTARCGTDRDAQRAYREALADAGFGRIEETAVEHREALPFDALVGSVYSAMTPETIPTGREREDFETRLRAALGAEPYPEDVRVSFLVGRSGTG